MADKSPMDFVVRLEDVSLDQRAAARVAARINAAVLEELATVDFGGSVLATIPNKEWLGIWLRPLGRETIPTLRVQQGRG